MFAVCDQNAFYLMIWNRTVPFVTDAISTSNYEINHNQTSQLGHNLIVDSYQWGIIPDSSTLE